MKVSVMMTPTRALIYARLIEKEKITHFTTDAHFDLYMHIRSEVPKMVILFDTRRELVARLAKMNYFL